MGKVLIEKLLRSCPLRKIYMLMRPKRGSDVRQRVDEMFAYEVRKGKVVAHCVRECECSACLLQIFNFI